MIINKKKIIIGLTSLVLVFIGCFGYNVNVVNAANTVTVDYGSHVGTGSPYIFGGVHYPNRTHLDAWNQLPDMGVTFMRADARLQEILPANITLDDYKNNVNNVADSSTWNFDRVEGWLDLAKAQGFKTMLMSFEIPTWLSYSNNAKGVPKDWAVYQDIIKKVYIRLQDKIDFYEFLNEPKVYIDLAGSPYSNVNEAAKDQYYYSVKAVREISSTLPVGGGAEDTWGGDFGAIGPILRDTRLDDNDINFISIHCYEYDGVDGFDRGQELRTFIQNQGRDRNLPIYMNEWNKDWNNPSTPLPEVGGKESISYHGYKLMKLMKDGWEGAAYYDFYPGNVVNDDYWAWTETGHGLYLWDSSTNTATINLFNKTWELYSVKMGLGNGYYSIRSTNYSGVTNAAGMVSASNEPVVLASNHTSSSVTEIFTLNNLPVTGNVTVEVYIASDTNDPSTPIETLSKTITNGTLTHSVTMPAYSAVGLIVKGGTPVTSTSTSYEAEASNHTLSGYATIFNESTVSNGQLVGYVGAGANNYLQMNNINVETTGTYTMTIHYRSGEDRSADVSINGESAVSINFPSLGNWSDIGSVDVTVNLNAGDNTIKFSNNTGYAPDFDKIVIDTSTATPSVSYEAEVVDNTLGGAAVVMNVSQASNGQTVGYVGAGSGNYLQFNKINVQTAGTYNIKIYYMSGETRYADMSVNSGVATSITFPSLGDWTSVGVIDLTVYLVAGDNTIKFSNNAGYAPDFDYLEVF